MGIIDVKNLHKIYHDTGIPVHAVNGIDISFDEGEFTAIVGASGCGKTTFFNMIGGLDSISEGEVSIDGTTINTLNAYELTDLRLKKIGFVFQAYNLIPVLTAKENVEFIMELQGVSKEARTKRSQELLDAVGIGHKIHNRPSELSGGQQQRVAVARALASKPKFVIADEPTANLDSKSTTELLYIMLKMNQELNITFLFSTHDQRVMDRARRIVTMDDGKIIADRIMNS